MKKFTTLFVLFLLLSMSQYGQEAWHWQNPMPEGNTLNDVAIFGPSYAVAVGYLGLILRSADNGETWTKISSGTKFTLWSVSINSSGTGWIVGNGGTVLKTSDNGLTWTPQSTGTGGTCYSVVTPDGIKCYIGVSGGRFIKTANGGSTWELTTTQSTKHVRSVSTDGLGSIYLAQDGGIIQKSTDDGITWTIRTTGITKALSKITFAGNLGVAVGAGGIILRSTDAGDTWSLIPAPTTHDLTDVINIDGSHILISVIDGLLYSSDAGLSFTPSEPFGDYGGKNALAMKPNAYYLCAGYTGWIHKSTNLTDWSTCIDGLKLGGLWTIWFNDPNTGFTAGDKGIIYKTIDAGNTWTETETDPRTYGYFYTFYFFNRNVGFAGCNAELFRTTDGGEKWSNVLSYFTNPLLFGIIESIYFVDINYGWFVTSDGQIWKSSNGGVTWDLCFNEADNDLTGVWFADRANGVVTGGKGTVLRTSNGGATWTLVNSNASTEHFYAMHAFDLQNLIVAAGETIQRSTDGGITWTVVELPPSSYYNFYNIMFINKNIGWVSGQWGVIMKTTDGGATWVRQVSNMMETVYKVHFVDENNGWACGNYAGIIHTTSGGISGTGEIPTVTASGFQLNQNYPNPFDHTTTLSYSLPRSSPVKIEIYNILGLKIRTLIDKEQDPGKHQVKFDGSGLPGGIYFCRLTCGSTSTSAIRLLKN